MEAAMTQAPAEESAKPTISRDAALRIAMAARILPEISVGQLLEILMRRIGGEINEDTLSTIPPL